MPIYFFWGDDDFKLNQAVQKLRETVIDPQWSSFNYHKISGDRSDANLEAFHQAMTPPFGLGGRLVWLAETTLCQQCSEELLSQLQQTLKAIAANSHFLLTSSKKPDGRLKSSKILQQSAEIREFSLIPPWKTEELIAKVEQVAQEIGINLTQKAIHLLADSIGNNTRKLWSELEKLKLYHNNPKIPVDLETITALVNISSQNSLQLAEAIRQGNTPKSLALVADLLNRNEPPLKIIATLIGQFRTWTIVRLWVESGEKDDKIIANAAEINNPKRIYFLRKEIQSLKSEQLLGTLPLLLDLESSLKRGAEPASTLQIKMIELCQLFRP